MRTKRMNLLRLIGLIAVLVLATAGCGGGGGTSGKVNLSDAEFTVGSKEFTEQLILGQITLQALENPGRRSTTRPAWQGRSLPARRSNQAR